MIHIPELKIKDIQNNKISISALAIEVTRKCNFYCDHCLRGEQEKLDIDLKYIDILLNKVDTISNITFTGGEPSLNLKAITYTREKILEYDITLGFFYIATNGTSNDNEEFVVELLRLYATCNEPDMCAVEVSSDDFHDIHGTQDMELLGSLRFTNKRDENELYDSNYISEGLYKENFGTKGRILPKEEFTIDNNYINEGTIYLNCEGNIIAGCNWSYESQRKSENIICRCDEDIIYNLKQKGFLYNEE